MVKLQWFNVISSTSAVIKLCKSQHLIVKSIYNQAVIHSILIMAHLSLEFNLCQSHSLFNKEILYLLNWPMQQRRFNQPTSSFKLAVRPLETWVAGTSYFQNLPILNFLTRSAVAWVWVTASVGNYCTDWTCTKQTIANPKNGRLVKQYGRLNKNITIVWSKYIVKLSNLRYNLFRFTLLFA